MAITVDEIIEGNTVTQSARIPQRTARFAVKGTDIEADAILAFETSVPASYQGLGAEQYSYEYAGSDLWIFTIEYTLQEITQAEDLDTTGGMRSTKLSYGTRSYAAAGKVAPVFGGAINCHDGEIDGVDITEPTYKFSLTRTMAIVDTTYKQILFQLTGKYNAAPFRDFAAYEVLFLGARGRKAGRDYWQLQYEFAASPNMTNIILGGGISVPVKYGWEYLWVFFDNYPDMTARRLVNRPRAAYVEQVYLPGDFSQLGLGV